MPSIFIAPIYGPKALTSVLPALALGQNISKCEQVGGILGCYLRVCFILTVTQLTRFLAAWDNGVWTHMSNSLSLASSLIYYTTVFTKGGSVIKKEEEAMRLVTRLGATLAATLS